MHVEKFYQLHTETTTADVPSKQSLSGKKVTLKKTKYGFQDHYRLLQVKVEHSAILSTFIKLPIGIKIFVLLILCGTFTLGFTVHG